MHIPHIRAAISGMALDCSVLSAHRPRSRASSRRLKRPAGVICLIAATGQARTHLTQRPHRFFNGLSGSSCSMSVSTVTSRTRGPYCGVTMRRLLPCQPSPDLRATARCDRLPRRFGSSATLEAGIACAAKRRPFSQLTSAAAMRSKEAFTDR